MTKSEKNQTYTELKQELDSVLASLQQDDIDVDEALKAYEQGMELIKQLGIVLKDAENKITKLKTKFD